MNHKKLWGWTSQFINLKRAGSNPDPPFAAVKPSPPPNPPKIYEQPEHPVISTARHVPPSVLEFYQEELERLNNLLTDAKLQLIMAEEKIEAQAEEITDLLANRDQNKGCG